MAVKKRRYRSADSFTISRGVRSIAPSTLSWRRCRLGLGVALAPAVRLRRTRGRIVRIVTAWPLGFGLYASRSRFRPRSSAARSRSRLYSGTIPERFFSGSVALTTPLPANRLGRLDELSVDTAPTGQPFGTIPERFFSRPVAFTAPLPANRLGGLDEFSVDAAPTDLGWCTIPERFFFRTVAFTTPLPANHRGSLDEFSVDAAPTGLCRCTIPERFFSRPVAFAIPLPAIRLGGLDDFSVDAEIGRASCRE